MKNIDWKSLKSGTDIRGVAVKADGREVTLTDDVVSYIAAAFVLFVSNKIGKNSQNLTIAVGHDSRISADRIKSAVCPALKKAGCKVLDCGLASTPAMFMITVDEPVDASVQITASHHPYMLNGLKFFTREGGLQGEDISYILGLCEDGEFPPETNGGNIKEFDYMSEYAARLKKTICDGISAENYDRPLEGCRIAVDAGNGVGGFYAEKVLKPLGADVSGSVFLNPDGYFPNHIPNPENSAAMAAISRAVTESHSDLGLIFDTDVDRAACVDGEGREINRNRLIALASSMALENCPGGTVVTDSVTSDGLKEFIEQKLGGVHHRFRRGYRNVINEAMRLESSGQKAPLAIETSGHAAFADNYFLDDGAYLMTRTVIKFAQLKKEGKSIDDLFSGLREPLDAVELRMNISGNDFRSYGEKVIEKLNEFAQSRTGFRIAPDNREGIRVNTGSGWFLLRLSVHDPVMPLNAESDKKGGCREIIKSVSEFLKSCDRLDLTEINNYLNK